MNALHPFREGNGGTQRLCFFLLARQDGWFLDWSQVTGQDMSDASSASLLREDNRAFKHLMLHSLAPLQPKPLFFLAKRASTFTKPGQEPFTVTKDSGVIRQN